MDDSFVRVLGQLAKWPSKAQMARVLRAAGLRAQVGQYSIRVADCSRFIFQEYGGDLGEPQIEAEADSLEEMLHDAKLVSNALTVAGLRHRFELYNDADELVAYVHYDWPQDKST
jgi:hypothetical protein